MANEDIQKESPGGIQKEPPQAEAPPGPSDDVKRFHRPKPVQNLTGQIALDLGVFSAFPTLMALLQCGVLDGSCSVIPGRLGRWPAGIGT